jgi:hypothetical protein
MVGQSHVNVEESEEVAMLKRRYAAGGISAGTEVQWKKQAPPPELARLMGYNTDDTAPVSPRSEEPVSGASWKKNGIISASQDNYSDLDADLLVGVVIVSIAQSLVVGEKAGISPEEAKQAQVAQLKQGRSKLLARKSVRGSKIISRNVEKDGADDGNKRNRRMTIYNLFGGGK